MYVPFTAKNGNVESMKNGLSSVNDERTNAASATAKGKNSRGNNDLEDKRALMIQNKLSEALPRDTHTAGITYDKEFDDEFEKLYKKDID